MHPSTLEGDRKSTYYAACFFAVIAAIMTFRAGYALGGDEFFDRLLIGSALAGVTVLVAILLRHVDKAVSAHNWGWALGLGVFWVACAFTEYGSHVMYTVGHRAMNEQVANVQDAVYTDTRGTVDDYERQIALWNGQLAALRDKSPWMAGVTADGIRASIANMEGDAIYKRSRQCASVTLPESRLFCDKIADLRAQLAGVTETKSLGDRIASTTDLLNKARDNAARVKPGSSIVSDQAATFASFATLTLKPDPDAKKAAGMGYGGLMSMVFTFAAAILFALWDKDWTRKVRFAGYTPDIDHSDTASPKPIAMPKPIASPGSTEKGQAKPSIVNHFKLDGLTPEHIMAALSRNGLAST